MSREQVIEAAIRCIEAEGPEALGVSRVARELGIKPPSIYNHVGKGDALARAVLIEGNRRLLGALKVAVRGIVPPGEQLMALAAETRRWSRGNSSLYMVMAQVPPDNEHPVFKDIMADIFDLFNRPLARLGLRDEDHLHAIRGLRAAIHGFLVLENSGQYALDTASEDSYRWLIASVLRGIQATAQLTSQPTENSTL